MPDEALPDFDAALLVLVASHGLGDTDGITAYDIVALTKEGNAGLLGRSPASVYTRLRALAELGYLEALDQVGKRGRTATRYRIAKKGYHATRAWLQETYAELPALDASDMFVRLRAAYFAEPELIWRGLKPLAFDIEEELDLLEKDERKLRRRDAWSTDPERRVITLKRRLLEAYRDALDEIRREYEMRDPLTED